MKQFVGDDEILEARFLIRQIVAEYQIGRTAALARSIRWLDRHPFNLRRAANHPESGGWCFC